MRNPGGLQGRGDLLAESVAHDCRHEDEGARSQSARRHALAEFREQPAADLDACIRRARHRHRHGAVRQVESRGDPLGDLLRRQAGGVVTLRDPSVALPALLQKLRQALAAARALRQRARAIVLQPLANRLRRRLEQDHPPATRQDGEVRFVDERSPAGRDDQIGPLGEFAAQVGLEGPEARLAFPREDLGDGSPLALFDPRVGIEPVDADKLRQRARGLGLPGAHEAGQDHQGSLTPRRWRDRRGTRSQLRVQRGDDPVDVEIPAGPDPKTLARLRRQQSETVEPDRAVPARDLQEWRLPRVVDEFETDLTRADPVRIVQRREDRIAGRARRRRLHDDRRIQNRVPALRPRLAIRHRQDLDPAIRESLPQSGDRRVRLGRVPGDEADRLRPRFEQTECRGPRRAPGAEDDRARAARAHLGEPLQGQNGATRIRVLGVDPIGGETQEVRRADDRDRRRAMVAQPRRVLLVGIGHVRSGGAQRPQARQGRSERSARHALCRVDGVDPELARTRG